MNCARCGTPILDRLGLAAQAGAVHAAVRAASLEGVASIEAQAALRDALARAVELALEHARAAACAAGDCRRRAAAPRDGGPAEQLVLARLREGPATAADLAEIAGRSVRYVEGLLRALERRGVVTSEFAGQPEVLTWRLQRGPEPAA